MTSATPKPRAGEHTPGPWFLSGVGTVLAGKSRYIVGDNIELHNAQRIVACVNACEGIPTTSLELGDTKQWIKEEIAMRAERDLLRERERELVEALESCLAAIGTMEAGLDPAALRLLAGIPAIEEKARNALGQEARSALAKHGR